jgi:hypothetical protein
VGAIHGRLLTAWATAGVLGPVIVNYLRDYQLDQGVPAHQAYNVIMYVLAALLLVGLLCNLLVRPVAEKHYMTEQQLEDERRISHEKAAAMPKQGTADTAIERHPLLSTAAWVLVGIPISYGVWSTLQKAWILFN